jgi:hypothetical protein
MSNVEKKTGDLTVWGAVGPNGQVVKSSIGTFKSVANRWAIRRGNYEVVKLGTVKNPAHEISVDEQPQRRRRGRPRKVQPELVQ